MIWEKVKRKRVRERAKMKVDTFSLHAGKSGCLWRVQRERVKGGRCRASTGPDSVQG